MTRPVFAAIGTFAAAMIALGAVAGPVAAARAVAGTNGGGSITLTGQPAWSTLGNDVTLRLNIAVRSTAGLEVSASVYAAVLSRTAFEKSLTGELGGSRTTRTVAVDALPVLGTDRLLTLGLQDPAAPYDASRVSLALPGSGTAGVFPVEIQLREPNGGTVLDSFVTDLVAVRRRSSGEPPNEHLRVAWLWNIATAPTPPGTTWIPSSLEAAVAPRGRLGRLAAALGQVSDVPITLVPSPETIDALQAVSATSVPAQTVLGAIRAASKSALVLTSPYTILNGPGLMRSGLVAALDAATTAGRAALETGLETAVDHTIAAPQPLDAPTLSEMRRQTGTTRVVVDPNTLTRASAPDQFTASRPFRLDSATSGDGFDALEINPTASELLTRAGPDALRSQQVLASLAVIALEEPNRVRGVVINTPLLWDASPSRIEAVLAGLRNHPLLQGATVGNVFDSVQAATVNRRPYSRTLAPVDAPAAPIGPAEYTAATRMVDGLGSMIGVDEPVVSRLRSEILMSLASRVPGTGAAVSAQRLAVITRDVGAVTSRITAPTSRAVTLTSRRASVPLSIENKSGRVVKIRVTLASQKLKFPRGADQIVDLKPGNNTRKFDVEALTSGTFPLLVTVGAPDGNLDLQHSRYTIRSSAVSGVGLVLTISAGLFLALWWVTHWRRSRRPLPPAVAS